VYKFLSILEAFFGWKKNFLVTFQCEKKVKKKCQKVGKLVPFFFSFGHGIIFSMYFPYHFEHHWWLYTEKFFHFFSHLDKIIFFQCKSLPFWASLMTLHRKVFHFFSHLDKIIFFQCKSLPFWTSLMTLHRKVWMGPTIEKKIKHITLRQTHKTF